MKRNGFTILAVLVFALGTFGLAYPNSGYWDNFKLAYSTSPLTNPPITNSAGQNCMVCHTGWPTTRAGVGTVNAYGNDYANANYNFGAIINNDPDGDGYTNLQEITAGTYPGDATSHPSAADTTPPVVGAFSIPATSTSLTVGITTFTATDVGGV